MRITISGPIGSGKSTVGKILSSFLGYKFFSGGEFFRQAARRMGLSLEDFNKYAETHPEIDKEQDEYILDFIRKNDGIVVESRLSGWLCYKNAVDAFKIFIDAPIETRIERVAKRESQPMEEVSRALREREDSELKRYREFYAIDYRITYIYDYTINTEHMSAEDVAKEIYDVLTRKNRC